MTTITVVDTNVVIRLLVDDHPQLSSKAKELFNSAQNGNTTIYIDEVIVAEIIWLMLSFYKKEKQVIISLLEKLLSQKWIVNPRKEILQKALAFYASHNVSFVDCWAMMIAKNKKYAFVTFDKTLDKLARSS